MRVVCTNSNVKELSLPWMDKPAQFASTGTSQELSDETAERLVEEAPDIEPYEDT